MGKYGFKIMKKLYLHPLFSIGILLRLGLMLTMAPTAVSMWYTPFLNSSLSTFTLDPWATWVGNGGQLEAFPYGYGMWLVFLPLSLLAKFLQIPTEYGYSLTMLVIDFALLRVLNILIPMRPRLLLATYWLSPIVMLATYIYGLNDLIPALFLCISIYYIRTLNLKLAGFFLAFAISSKFSMVIALPFFVIYLFNNKSLRSYFKEFITGFLIIFLLFGLPFLFSNAALHMLFENPELLKIYSLAFNLNGDISIFIVPLIYVLVLYMTWKMNRINFDLFHATMGIAFLLIILMTPAIPGWFIWAVPFLVFYQANSGRKAMVLIGLFSFLYLISSLLVVPPRFTSGSEIKVASYLLLFGKLGYHAPSIIHSCMVAIGLILVMRIWQEGIKNNNFFRLSRKPFLIGIAGDSGTGKDTLSEAITDVFGSHSVVKLSGDDYHLWDRQKPMWQIMTHLNPMANDLESFSNDIISLADGKQIHKMHYNHHTGKMSKPSYINSNDYIIVSGLHALYLPIIRDCFNLKIYLEMNEELRKFLKIKRDVEERGHRLEKVLESFEKRIADAKRFIHPQIDLNQAFSNLRHLQRLRIIFPQLFPQLR